MTKTIFYTAAAALACVSNATKLPRIGWRGEVGIPIGAGTEEGQIFTDSAGRKYAKDKRGTVRRCREDKQ